MLRSLLMGVLALSTASACTGKADAPAAQPGVAVGKVVEVSGDVNATRGTAKRALATGQDVSGDDTIETGAEGRVRILFAHNNATWELGPSKKVTVTESLAWTLPKQDAPAGTVDEATLAAGRHAERETVTTGNTAPAPLEQNKTAPGAAAVAPSDDLQAKGGGGEGGGGGGGEEDRKTEPARKAEPSRRRTGAATTDKNSRPMDDDADVGVVERTPPKAAITRDQETTLAPSPPPPPPPPPADPSAEIKKRIAEERATLIACMETNTLAVEVVVADGKTTFVLPAGTPETVTQCFRQAATKIQFPSSYTLRVKTPLTK